MLARHVRRELLERPIAAGADAGLRALGYAGGVALVAVGPVALMLGFLASVAVIALVPLLVLLGLLKFTLELLLLGLAEVVLRVAVRAIERLAVGAVAIFELLVLEVSGHGEE